MHGDTDSIEVLRQLLARGMWHSVLKRTGRVDPNVDDLQILSARAIALVQSGDLDAAIEIWNRCLLREPVAQDIRDEISATLVERLRMLRSAADRKQGKKIVKVLYTLNPRDPALWLELALAARARGLVDDYIICMNKVNEIDP